MVSMIIFVVIMVTMIVLDKKVILVVTIIVVNCRNGHDGHLFNLPSDYRHHPQQFAFKESTWNPPDTARGTAVEDLLQFSFFHFSEARFCSTFYA